MASRGISLTVHLLGSSSPSTTLSPSRLQIGEGMGVSMGVYNGVGRGGDSSRVVCGGELSKYLEYDECVLVEKCLLVVMGSS